MMNRQALRERDAVIDELNQIIRELEAAAASVEREQGIGSRRCANSLLAIARRYRSVRRRLLQLS